MFTREQIENPDGYEKKLQGMNTEDLLAVRWEHFHLPPGSPIENEEIVLEIMKALRRQPKLVSEQSNEDEQPE